MKGLNISVQQLLMKMENELIEAKACTTDFQIREKVYAIKSLCELILDTPPISSVKTTNPSAHIQPITETLAPKESNRLKMDEANGDSIFDF